MQKLVELSMEYEIRSLDLLSQKEYCLHWQAGGVCNTGDTFLTELSAVSGDVVDMEAYAQALVCRAKNVPSVSYTHLQQAGHFHFVVVGTDGVADVRLFLELFCQLRCV